MNRAIAPGMTILMPIIFMDRSYDVPVLSVRQMMVQHHTSLLCLHDFRRAVPGRGARFYGSYISFRAGQAHQTTPFGGERICTDVETMSETRRMYGETA